MKRPIRACMLAGALFTASNATAAAPDDQADGPNRLVLTPSTRFVYETNALRTPDEVQGKKDNLRTTVGADVIFNRRLGRSSVRASGSFGYDFNSRFKSLNRTRIDGKATATVPIGGRCRITPRASYQRFQTDPGELQTDEGNATEVVNFGAGALCPRAAGFGPWAAFDHNEGRNSSDARRPFDYRQDTLRAGVEYRKPSLGTLSLFGRWAKLSRPNIDLILPTAGGTETQEYGVSVERSISPRIRGTVGLSYLKTDPDQPGVPGFGGLGFDVDLSFAPSPPLVVRLIANRDVVGESTFNATYTVQEQYESSVDWQLSERSSVRAAVERSNRDFRGESAIISAPRLADQTTVISGAFRYDIRQKYRVAFTAGWRKRDAKVDRYDYDSAFVALGLGARF